MINIFDPQRYHTIKFGGGYFLDTVVKLTSDEESIKLRLKTDEEIADFGDFLMECAKPYQSRRNKTDK